MLACMSTLVAAHIEGHAVHPEEQAVVPAMAKAYSRDDYSAVCRFESKSSFTHSILYKVPNF